MHIFLRQIVLLGQRLALILGMFFIGRLFFYLHNLRYFAPAWPDEVLKSFFYGVQFDVSALVYFNLPFIILHLMPGNFFRGRISEKFLKYFFITVNGLLLLSNLMDAEYFRFTGKRSTSDIFAYLGISDDILNLIPRFIYDYWYILIIWLVLLFAAWKLYPRAIPVKSQNGFLTGKRVMAHTIMMLLVTAFLISLARGYRLKPLRVITAANYVSAVNMPLILNTPFTIMKSFNKQHLRVPEYFPPQEAELIFYPVHSNIRSSGEEKPNVVVIIMESFSKEYSGYLTGMDGYMPFLDSLMQESLHFPYAFANAKKSLEALPAILASIPALMETPFVSSPYSANKINSLPRQLKNAGYHTSFFHGGINGTMGFDDFARLAGIDNYYGKNEFGNDHYFDGYWGIYDEPFFLYFAGKLNTFPRPFFTSFFSLSSHHPYILPDKHKGMFPEGDLPVHKTIAYADYSLRMFFESAKDQPWFENTLFVITADHTYQSVHPYYRNRVGDYAVPILYYHPGNPGLKGKSLRITQHSDIMPSVLDYVDAEGRFVSFGSSVFSEKEKGFAVNFLNHLYQYLEDEWVLFHDGEQATGLFNFRSDSLLQRNYLKLPENEYSDIPGEHLEKRLKSIVQQFNYRMVNNRLTAD